MNDTSEKGHQLASILISVETVIEYDRLVTEFNLMQPTLRDHVERVEDINDKKVRLEMQELYDKLNEIIEVVGAGMTWV